MLYLATTYSLLGMSDHGRIIERAYWAQVQPRNSFKRCKVTPRRCNRATEAQNQTNTPKVTSRRHKKATILQRYTK